MDETTTVFDEISVFVVDRERAVAQALARRLDADSAVVVVGDAQDLNTFMRAVVHSRPDVVVLDERVADDQLSEVAARLMAPDLGCRLVVTSASADVRRAYEAVTLGASAFVTKSSGFEDMVRAIRGAVRGETWMPPRLLTAVFAELCGRRAEHSQEQRVSRLTEREREVLRCMMLGFDRSRIASELIVSVNTVRTHTQNILSKLEVHSSVEAVSVALQAGFPGGARVAR